jgi:hypothetical protein
MDMAVWRRKRRVPARVTRAAWRPEQAERERAWALAAAKAEGAPIREIAAAAGLSSSRVHQVVTDADIGALDAAPGALRSAGWPAPEDPGVDDGDLRAAPISPVVWTMRWSGSANVLTGWSTWTASRTRQR